MKKLILCLVLVLAIALPAGAQVYYNDGAVHNLSTSTSAMLRIGNNTTVNVGNGVTLSVNATVTYNTSYMGLYYDPGAGILNLTGSGSINFAQECGVGTSDGTGDGVITMSGTSYMNPACVYHGNRGDATFSITDDATLAVRSDGTQYTPGFYVGKPHYGYTYTATFNQSGNAVVSSGGAVLELGTSNTGIYNMSGGLLSLGAGISIGGTDDAFNYSGGTIIMTGNQSGTLLTLNDLTGGAVEVFDGTNTTITPEPATLLLLGLGGLLLRRRR